MEHTELNNIHDVYSTYRFLLENCQRCSANQKALNTELSVIETLLERIRLELNIFPSKAKLRFYRFLRWVQMPNN